VPTVVEVPVSLDPTSLSVLSVYNLTTSSYEPYYLTSTAKQEAASQVAAAGATGNPIAIADGNYATYLEFPVREGMNRGSITFSYSEPIAASSLLFSLDANVALPQTIMVTAETAQGTYTVVAPTRLYQTYVSFPKTTAAIWHITFDYIQPLRITEMKLNDLSSGTIVARGARFLAQPGQSYWVYLDADRYVRPVDKESGDLTSNKGVLLLSAPNTVHNPAYTPADSDTDGVPDLTDNCVSVVNSDQKDSDMNGRGDACEDYDRDGVVNSLDNCSNEPNQSQVDTDADGIGDVCDSLDNRITERLPWLPWAGIVVAALVLLGLFVMVFLYKKEETSEVS
jgi:hypothetical protein